jgi:predicted RNA binding protein YcfA (HicA-like mRNA interferase family)
MPSKLYPIKRKTFEKFLKYIGCTKKRTKGSHIIYSKPGLKRPVVITSDKEISSGIIRSNLRTLNLSTEEFQEIIRQL